MAEGSIVRLTLKDFMTFDDVTFRPGNKLNLVIGPNGSGKSSLSCAMVLGLAGKTKILGRAPEVGQYVKRGKKQAEIEIELFRKNNNNVVVKRTLTMDNKSSWFLNDRFASQKEVEDLMKSLQIQVDNLCQFLPQDRVHDFAKMNKQELLDNTQKSVGSPKLYEMFNELKNNMKLDVNHEKDVQKIKDQILKSEDSVAKLQAEIEKVKRKRKMLDNVANLKRKKAWLLFDERKERLDFLKKKTGDKHQHYKKKEKDLEPITKEIEKAEQRYSMCENQMGQLNNGARMDSGDARKMLQAVQELHDRIASIKSNLKQTIEADSRVTVEMKSLQNELDRVENCLCTVDREETHARLLKVEQRLALATKQRAEISDEVEEKKQTLENTKNGLRVVNHRIELVKNLELKKLNLLEAKDKDAYKVRKFYQENKHLFSGKVYGPIFIELNVSQAHSKYVESILSRDDKISFLCEEASDVTKLIELCRSQQKLCFNVFAAPPYRGPVRNVYTPVVSNNDLRSMGFDNYLLDFLDGPETVLRYLCHNSRVHNIPVGNKSLEEMNVEQINECGIRRFCTDKQVINLIQSRYTNSSRQKSSLLITPHMFVHDGTTDPRLEQRARELSQELNKNQSSLSEASSRRKEHEDIVNGLFNERDALRKSQETVKHMLSKKENIRREICRLEKNRINREVEEKKAYASKKAVFDKCITRLVASVDKAGISQEKNLKNSLLSKKSNKLQDDIAAKKEAAKEARQELSALKTELADYEQKCLVLKKEADTARKEALATTDNLSPDSDDFKRRFAKAFLELPETGDEIQQKIIDFQARADCLGINEQAIVEYEKLKTDIQRLQTELEEKSEQCNVLRARSGQIKNKWLAELKQLVATINKSFSVVFKRMGCEGEVLLTNNGNEEDILKFGLTIRVKFREEDELQELDIFRQSGGERAVTIGIYMLSLQELTHVPFRCLDEINQGMDEQNERRFFNTLVETVKNNSVSQYFLLTPKLLHGLNYKEEVQVHVIFNGKGAVPDSKWLKVNRMLERMGNRKRKYEDDTDSD